MNLVDMKKQAMQISDTIQQASVKIVLSQSDAFNLCVDAAREIERLREALTKAKNYLSKVDCYREDIADEADYFCKVTIENLLKSGSEINESDGK